MRDIQKVENECISYKKKLDWVNLSGLEKFVKIMNETKKKLKYLNFYLANNF